MLSSLKVALVAPLGTYSGAQILFPVAPDPCLTIPRGHPPCFSCCHPSWPGLGSRVSSWEGIGSSRYDLHS